YFAFHGYHGNYGLLAQRHFEQEIADLTIERDTLRAARSQREHRVGLLRADRLDPDLLDELARRDLGVVKPNDLVLLNPSRCNCVAREGAFAKAPCASHGAGSPCALQRGGRKEIALSKKDKGGAFVECRPPPNPSIIQALAPRA